MEQSKTYKLLMAKKISVSNLAVILPFSEQQGKQGRRVLLKNIHSGPKGNTLSSPPMLYFSSCSSLSQVTNGLKPIKTIHPSFL
jgi:hypothetical protein